MKYICAAVVFVFGLLATPAFAATFRDDPSASVSEPINDDTYVSGQTVTITSPINGELFVAGRNVSITKRNTRSILVAGDNIHLDEGAGYNAYAVGNTIVLRGTIEHDVYVIGQSVTFDPSTKVLGSVYAYGSRLNLAGTIGGDVIFNGQRLDSSAVIAGGLTANAGIVQFTGGSIAKDVRYQSNREAEGLDKVTIHGTVERTPSDFALFQSKRSLLRTWLLSFLTPLVVGAALILLLPKQLADVAHSLSKDWLHHVLYGVLIFLIAPIALLLLASSFVAWPLVVIGFMLYVILLYISSIIGKIIFGQRLLELLRITPTNWWLSLLVGTLVISLLSLVPYVNGILAVAVFLGLTIPALSASLLWWRKRLS